jgi:hypothetical protein
MRRRAGLSTTQQERSAKKLRDVMRPYDTPHFQDSSTAENEDALQTVLPIFSSFC